MVMLLCVDFMVLSACQEGIIIPISENRCKGRTNFLYDQTFGQKKCFFACKMSQDGFFGVSFAIFRGFVVGVFSFPCYCVWDFLVTACFYLLITLWQRNKKKGKKRNKETICSVGFLCTACKKN